jgi:integrase/recombinase XerD
MKPFESFMSRQLEEYITHRQGLGYNPMPTRYHLVIFDHYLIQSGANWDSLQPAFFLEMRSKLTLEPASVNNALTAIRGFFSFLMRRDMIAHNPLEDIPPLKENIVVPFVFSPLQIEQLLKICCQRIRKNKACFLTDMAIYLALTLMARCGLRISEPVRLLKHNYRPDEASIYIEKTKFKKDRLIPIPKTVASQIKNYISARQTIRPDDANPYLLAGRREKPLSATVLKDAFHNAVREMGLKQPRRVMGNVNFNPPRSHSLRHSFAVNTLIKIKERGESAQYALPILAAYMGHSDYKHTAVYLKVADAASRKNLIDFTLWQKRKE